MECDMNLAIKKKNIYSNADTIEHQKKKNVANIKKKISKNKIGLRTVYKSHYTFYNVCVYVWWVVVFAQFVKEKTSLYE